jgi:hypothetical protein
MTLGEIDIWQILDILLLLLIGMGPKVALVPFLDLTAGMDGDTRTKVATGWYAQPRPWPCSWWCWVHC